MRPVDFSCRHFPSVLAGTVFFLHLVLGSDALGFVFYNILLSHFILWNFAVRDAQDCVAVEMKSYELSSRLHSHPAWPNAYLHYFDMFT